MDFEKMWKEEEKKKSEDSLDFESIERETERILRTLATLIETDPGSEEVQTLIDAHYKNISKISHYSKKGYLDLIEMYASEPTLFGYYDQYAMDMTFFMREAIKIYCKSEG